ncbi:AraC family transcriptional regulator [Siphonobacter aquaeclarae]|jgi:AraC-like DNA-binding protein|uniref:AraC-type DNA-binding protein n=1 Tax=Siphonobacter aquaeclarae TaxID=563176 RepID=A0A1G9VGK5_9BACT|nr:AraC family transcriptional regulator [Siphonobacter aquaeclarae]MBO9637087.1 helix-turn-helix domain-containing protein [Siphonobacter aquaeclarae]SDM71191.1 AraC-type DNA-binding protein [Siphonobacter aquaeclarae]
MLRVPSFIHAGEFESLKIQEMTFVAYRNQDPPLRNEVFFEEHAVIFVLEGEKRFLAPEREISVRKGDVVFIRRGYYFMQEAVERGYRSLVFFFHEKLLKSFVEQHLEVLSGPLGERDIESPLLVFPGHESLQAFAEAIFPLFQRKTPFLNQFLRLKSHELLLLLLEHDSSGQLHAFLNSIYQGEKMDLEWLLKNYFLKPLTLDELARLSGRSLSSFKRDFEKEFGTSPATWIRKKRLEHAVFLLETSSRNVSEISYEIGYESVSHFIKAFKAQYGLTPALYPRTKNAIV